MKQKDFCPILPLRGQYGRLPLLHSYVGSRRDMRLDEHVSRCTQAEIRVRQVPEDERTGISTQLKLLS